MNTTVDELPPPRILLELKNMCAWLPEEKPAPHRPCIEYVPEASLQAAIARAGREARVDMLIKTQNLFMKEREDIPPSVYQHLYSILETYIQAEAKQARASEDLNDCCLNKPNYRLWVAREVEEGDCGEVTKCVRV